MICSNHLVWVSFKNDLRLQGLHTTEIPHKPSQAEPVKSSAESLDFDSLSGESTLFHL
nr:hypothetical protein [uncultured bacterium]